MGAAVELNLAEVAAWAQGVGNELSTMDWGAPLKVGALVATRQAKENFEGQHEPDGTPWQPLKPATIAGRRLGKEDRKAITLKARAPFMTGSQKYKMGKEISAKTEELKATHGLSHSAARGLATAHVEARWRDEEGHSIRTKSSILSARSVQILRDTGVLMGSVIGQGRGAENHLMELTKNIVNVGSILDYAPPHQFGAPSKNIPARPFLGFTEQNVDEIVTAFNEFVGERLGA